MLEISLKIKKNPKLISLVDWIEKALRTRCKNSCFQIPIYKGYPSLINLLELSSTTMKQ